MFYTSQTLMSIFLGIIQGISEFLPISSSGHLILFSYFYSGHALPLDFNIALHFGTALAVIIFFWRDWLLLIRNFVSSIGCEKKVFWEKNQLLSLILVGSIPAGIAGIAFNDIIGIYLHSPFVVILPLAIVGFYLYKVDRDCPQSKQLQQMSLKNALLIGFAQMAALIPGVSRSGATILAARYLRFNRVDAARFSFMLGTPAMVGAALLHARDFSAGFENSSFWIGILTSFMSGCITIQIFLKLVSRFGFLFFAIYRAVLAAVILVCLIS